MHDANSDQGEAALLCRVGGLLCALPLQHVEETMRPLPVEPIGGAPSFLLGLSIIRASAVPVVDAALLLGNDRARPARFVTLKAGGRRIALAVDVVVGIRVIRPDVLDALPPLFQGSDAVAAVATLDSELMLVLRSARMIPPDAWTVIDASGEA